MQGLIRTIIDFMTIKNNMLMDCYDLSYGTFLTLSVQKD
jgi:hypothetical protein